MHVCPRQGKILSSLCSRFTLLIHVQKCAMVQLLHDLHRLSGQMSTYMTFCRDHPLRPAQLVLACVYGMLIGYSALHRGWWMDIQLPIILGCRSPHELSPSWFNFPFHAEPSTTDLALGSTICPFILSYLNFRHDPGAGVRATLVWVTRFSFDLVLVTLWIITGYTMCFLDKGKDYRNLFNQPPYKTWFAASFITGFEATSFIWTGVRILRKAKDCRDARVRGHRIYPR